jgi:excisionase family DNA binding protein
MQAVQPTTGRLIALYAPVLLASQPTEIDFGRPFRRGRHRDREDEMAAQEPMHTVAEVAQRLKSSRGLVYVLCETGKLSHHRIGVGRGTIRITESDLEAFLQATRVETPRPATAVGLKHIRLARAGSR